MDSPGDCTEDHSQQDVGQRARLGVDHCSSQETLDVLDVELHAYQAVGFHVVHLAEVLA